MKEEPIVHVVIAKRNRMNKYFLELSLIAGAFLAPLSGVVGAMFAFVIVDLITGLMKVRAKARRDADRMALGRRARCSYIFARINSRSMSNSVAKFIFYLSGIVLAHITNYQLGLEMPLVKMILGLIIAIELKSIDENMRIVLGYSVFGKLIDIIQRPSDDSNRRPRP